MLVLTTSSLYSSTTCQVPSPRKNLVLSAVPEPNLAVAIVPLVSFAPDRSPTRAAAKVPLLILDALVVSVVAEVANP